jgi:DNA-binding winged helix-turn-helix (wHTH) protein/tetratricopeptide (TPR) repeat protein/TolB-like protein
MVEAYDLGPFRVDLVRRVLLRDGEPVAITPKAFSLLLILLERRGGAVSKEELILGVWGTPDVSDANVMQNVSSLRKALGERAGESRYIVTVPGQGYRFVGDAVPFPAEEPVGEEASEGTAPLLPSMPIELSSLRVVVGSDGGGQPEEGGVPPLPTPSRPRRTYLLIALCAVLFLAGAGTFLIQRFTPWLTRQPQLRGEARPDPANRPGIAILGFRNLSGEPQADWLGPAFAEMLATELGAGGRVRVISGENVARVRRSLGAPALEHLDADSLRRIYNLLGADLVIDGSYLALSEASDPSAVARRVRLDLRVLSVPQGEVIASVAEVGDEPDLFGLVTRTGSDLRNVLGLADLTPAQARAAQALQPSTPEAARLYVQGLERLRAFDPPGALELLEEAARADPESAPVRSALAQAWLDMGEDARAVTAAREALRLAVSLPREERLAIEARLHAAGRAWDKAVASYRTLWTFYPDNTEYGLQLVASLTAAGRGAEASGVIADLRRLPPPVRQDPRIDLAEARVAKRISDPVREKRLAETAAAKGRRSGESLVVAQALLLQADALLLIGQPGDALEISEQARELFAAAGHHAAVASALAHRGVALHELSQLDEAEEAYAEALTVGQRLGNTALVAGQKANLGLLAQDRGDLGRALLLLTEAHVLYQRTGDRVLEARALNAIGTLQRAGGEMAGAQRSFERALALARQTGNRTDEARAASFLGTVLAERGELREALRLHETAFALLRQMGDDSRAAGALTASARVLVALGDLPLARRRLERALESRRRAGDRLGTAETLDAFAELARVQGDFDAVRRLADQQLRIGEETGAAAVTARALRHLGAAALNAGDLAGARRDLTTALEELNGAGQELDLLEIRLELAHVALAEGHVEEAARTAREAAAWYGNKGVPGGQVRALSLLAEALAAEGKGGGGEAP